MIYNSRLALESEGIENSFSNAWVCELDKQCLLHFIVHLSSLILICICGVDRIQVVPHPPQTDEQIHMFLKEETSHVHMEAI